jgi:single-strand DNA-binding protein
MANLNKVMLIGRLTRDPETRTFANGGKVAQFGFAVTGTRKKNEATGQWEDEPCFLDCKAFNSMNERGRKLADLVEQYLRKGHLAYVEGHLVLEQWTSQQDGSKQSKIRVVVDHVEFLQPKEGGMSEGNRASSSAPLRSAPVSRQPASGFPPANHGGFEDAPHDSLEAPQQSDQDIPF